MPAFTDAAGTADTQPRRVGARWVSDCSECSFLLGRPRRSRKVVDCAAAPLALFSDAQNDGRLPFVVNLPYNPVGVIGAMNPSRPFPLPVERDSSLGWVFRDEADHTPDILKRLTVASSQPPECSRGLFRVEDGNGGNGWSLVGLKLAV